MGVNSKLPTTIVVRQNLEYLKQQGLLWAMPAE